MTASAFRQKVLHANFMPRAIVHYLVTVAETLNPDARERIAGDLASGESKILAAATKASKAMTALEAKSTKKKKAA